MDNSTADVQAKPDAAPELHGPAVIEAWLNAMGLAKHLAGCVETGLDCMEDIAELENEPDLLDECGVTDAAEKKKMLLCAKALAGLGSVALTAGGALTFSPFVSLSLHSLSIAICQYPTVSCRQRTGLENYLSKVIRAALAAEYPEGELNDFLRGIDDGA